jgi:amidase
MKLKQGLKRTVLAAAVAMPGGAWAAPIDVVETTIADIQAAIRSGVTTPEEVTQVYLDRISVYDTAERRVTDLEGRTFFGLNSFAHVNQRALADARASDPAGVLYGVPIVLKDNIDTADMPTSAGSVALRGSLPLDDAFITRKLRAAGAIILGKATLTEFANFLTNGMPTGYSSLNGYGYNPYDPRPDPRTTLDALGRPLNDGRPVLMTGGSSSGPGIAVAASLAAVGIGTETSGSILSPGTMNMLVGIKPTVGLVSRDGIIPIAADQDTAGPLARTVRDAAIVLGAIAGFDPKDPETFVCNRPNNCFSDYTQFLDPNALVGARIAVPPFPANRADVMNNAIAVMRAQGATVELIPALAPQLPGCPTTPLANTYPPSYGPPPGAMLRCSTVLLYAFKRDLNAYFATNISPLAPVRSLDDVVAFNAARAGDVPSSIKYGQDLALFSQRMDTGFASRDTSRYLIDRNEDITRSRAAITTALNGPDGMANTADDYAALLFSGNSGAATPAKAGFPSIVVPGGFFDNSNVAFPADFKPLPGPAGVTFSGRAFSEPRLIALAFAFEQATKFRVAPPTTPALQ